MKVLQVEPVWLNGSTVFFALNSQTPGAAGESTQHS